MIRANCPKGQDAKLKNLKAQGGSCQWLSVAKAIPLLCKGKVLAFLIDLLLTDNPRLVQYKINEKKQTEIDFNRWSA